MKHNKLTSLIINAMSAMVAAAQIRWNKQCKDKKYLKHGAHVAYRWPSRNTTTAAQLKRAAKKRANIRARSKK